jgi:hypothetical protein
VRVHSRRARALERLSLYRWLSPPGTLGAFLSDLALIAFRRIGPNFAQENGLDTISIFMWPCWRVPWSCDGRLLWLSNHAPRRLVIAGASLAAAAAAAGFVLASGAGLPTLLGLGLLFGGFGIPISPLCVAHANDRLRASEMLAAA